MSTEFTSDDSDPEYTMDPPVFVNTSPLEYVVTHVFLPIKLPHGSDYTLEMDLSLARKVCAAAHAHTPHLYGTTEEDQWCRITKMLDNMQASLQSERLEKEQIISQLRGMQTGDILAFFIRPRNAAIILTKRVDCTLCEAFEVSPSRDAVQKTGGSLICSYPWTAVETPNEVFDDSDFQLELASFLTRHNAVDSDSPPPPTHPQYITVLLTGILRGVGRNANVPRIIKRIRDDVLPWQQNDDNAWRRSPLWLLIRVAIQTSVDRSPPGRASYKRFMLFFICTLAIEGIKADLQSDLLNLMSSKILRRFSKLESEIPDWLYKTALKTCARLREVLDVWWKSLSTRPSPFCNPSQDELARDTQLLLLDSREYICSALTNPGPKLPRTPFYPSHRRRGTIEDYLSSNGSFFDEAYDADPHVTLYDIEQLVEQGIDDWLACVMDVDDACARLENLMDKYTEKTIMARYDNPEDASIRLLTQVGLFIALDKLVIKEIPMLADYSPGIPTASLEGLFLRKTTSLHRLSSTYQYLSARHSQSCPGWSLLSNDITEDSFSVRYYDQSPHLQQLKVRIEQDVVNKVVRTGLQPGFGGGGLTHPHDEYHEHLPGRPTEDPEISRSPLPALLSHAKAAVFELQCPPCVHIWRSAAIRILGCSFIPGSDAERYRLLVHVPELQPYLVKRQGPLVQLCPAYFYPERFTNSPTLCYIGARCPETPVDRTAGGQPNKDFVFRGRYGSGFSTHLERYVDPTSSTSNDILVAEANCPADFSLDEFIAFGHLRSGGSLQWLNILHGLCCRTLNLRRPEVHFLLAFATFQVGPLDLNTGTWIWHQELEDPSFCNILLDELECLFLDIGAHSIDGVLMSTISLLLTRILASSPSEDISNQSIALLRSISKKTFSWVQDLSYNLAMEPTNEERGDLLLAMATTCRSTFDGDHATLRKLIQSAEDVDALLSCAFFIHALGHTRRQGSPTFNLLDTRYPQRLLERDSHLSLVVEEILRDVVLVDPSDYGIDLAVAKVFVSHQPGPHRWEPSPYPSARWLTCKTKVTGDQPSKTVYISLLDGELRVDGQLFGSLPPEIMCDPEFRKIFRDQGFFVIPSDLPGMDFTTLSTKSNYKAHFSWRGDNLVVRARSDRTKEVFELIHSEKLQKDLPPALVDGHVHWLSLSSKVIEIRPLERLWEHSSENWMIDCTSGQYCARKGRETLVDTTSPTWTMLSECFECFEDEEHPVWSRSQTRDILITTSPVSSAQSTSVLRLSVTLPRYGLSFFVNEREELESCDFKDMVYDEDQCIGALFGLQNLLVLRPRTRLSRPFTSEALVPRRILIPYGFLEEHDGPQVWVRNRTGSYYTYDVDTELGCLVGDGSFGNTCFLAYAHAKTSWHRPDPLTSKTGAQAGLSLLQSGGCRSIMELNSLFDEAYSIYPQINIACKEIFNRYYWNSDGRGEIDLKQKRAAKRATCLFPFNNSSQVTYLEDCIDMDYSTPELDAELEDVVSTAASAVYRWAINKPDMDVILSWAKLWSDNMHANTTSPTAHDGTEAWVNPGLTQTLRVMVHGILETGEGTRRRFQLLFLLPTIAYRSPPHQTAFFSMLIAFATQMHPRLRNPPIHAGCNTLDGYRPTEQVLRDHIRRSWIKGSEWEDSEWYMESDPVKAAIKRLSSGWPRDTPPTISLNPRHWNVAGLTASLRRLFSSCYCNWNLKEHLVRVLAVPELPALPRRVPSIRYISNERQITLDQLLSNRPAPELPPRSTLSQESIQGNRTAELSTDTTALDQLFPSLPADSAFQREYLTLLETSAGMCKGSRTIIKMVAKNYLDVLEKYYVECKTNYMGALANIKRSLGPTTHREQGLEQFGHWPPITADVLLRYLASTQPIDLPGQWKTCLMLFSLLLLELQRARRLFRFALDDLEEEFVKELENEQCDGWNPEEHPDWLLIQVQGNFLIRRTQVETAIEMISPRSGQNTVMQVNMGEGKSSVIIPIIAAALADGKQLVRVVIPKALTVQMFEHLFARLGGFANRPIYYLPFSRSPKYDYRGETDSLGINDHHKLMSQCMAEHGILLVQPEHVVSLKLMSVEQKIRQCNVAADSFSKPQKTIYDHITTGPWLKSSLKDSFAGRIFEWWGQSPNPPIASDAAQADHRHGHSMNAYDTLDNAYEWVSLQKWLHAHVRDILDESDEILHPRFQLTYTIGLEQHIDGYPDRWTIIQQVLRLVKDRARTISRNHPDTVEYERGPSGSFPYVRIARASDVGGRLISMIVQDVMDGRLPGFNFQHLPTALRDAIRSYISDVDVLQVPNTVKSVEEYATRSGQNHLWSGLLLLRGLLALNIIQFTLAERRWRIDYGLAERPRASTMLAIPYRAKDVPAPNTQFGHPDLTIILTCLSYYYAGLTEEQLRASFEILLDQDDPSTEYALWVREYDVGTVPDSLRKLGEINLRSSEQWDKITFPLFSRNQATIDFYLSRVVFPKEAKEFPRKLSGSSWDLGEKRAKLITGFSGTNDGRWLLPMSVIQHDLDHQQGTSASVLAYLLQPENDFYMVIHDNGGRRTSLELLQLVTAQRPEIRVLLDVGAQILDLSNYQVAEAWLDIARDAVGAIYFNEYHELTVSTRSGIIQPLSSSPLSHKLEYCVVYLDHAHTRGTDLKLPVGSRAAVTLGPKVTKDALVQGCMRMRKLGRGHSVMFFAPLGVDQSIRTVTGKKNLTSPVTTVDIISWAIHETWTDIQHRAPYWAQQGLHHKTRYDAWSRFCNDDLTVEELANAWLQQDGKSLPDLYTPCEPENAKSDLSAVPGLQQRCKVLGVLSLPGAQLEEEQEREVSREREREREVELLPLASPAVHHLHQDVVTFVKTGVIPPLHSRSAFFPVFTTLENSSAATCEADVWSQSILATADFCRTINPEYTEGSMDQYLRPVQWVLSRKNDCDQVLVLLSPFEADQLIAEIKASEYVHLHVYAPRTSQRMKPSGDLKLYSIPPLPLDWTPPWALIDQLNVFAGQLYLSDYESYLRLCRFLNIPTKDVPNDVAIRRNLFNIPGSFEETEITFSGSPLASVKALLAIRTRGRPFDHTHMGKILQGQLLTEQDFANIGRVLDHV